VASLEACAPAAEFDVALLAAMRESAQPATTIAKAASTTVIRMQRDERFKTIPPDR
jgi:hypothetical protein